MPSRRTSNNRWNYTKKETETIINKMILILLDEIINYKGPGCIIPNKLVKVTDIEKQTPLVFQQRFFLLMDIMEPAMDYGNMFIKREHPEMLFLYEWLCKLYTDEAQQSTSTKHNYEVD